MPPKGHAILSASSSDRWLHCPPSARLCEIYADKGSDYAAEGTDAHALCEYKLKKALGIEAPDPTENLTWYSEEMEECANGYAAYILELVQAAKESCADPKVLIEQRVDFSRWVELFDDIYDIDNVSMTIYQPMKFPRMSCTSGRMKY